MNAEQADQYIGLPWSQDGNGPDEWNCWNLLRHLLRKYFNKNIPLIGLEDSEQLRAMYKERLNSGAWVRGDNPAHGRAVLLKGGMHPHVGLYLDIDGGGVIHSLEGSKVVFTPLGALRMLGFGKIEYYEVVR